MITTVIFDLDQTLLNRTATFTRFLEQQYGRFEDELKEVPADTFVATILKYDNNGYTPKVDVYDQLCQEWQLAIATELLADFHAHYGFEPVLNEGAIEVLQELSGNYRLGLITNGRTKGQNAKIDRAGIRHFFEAIKISETEGIKKPHPDIFSRCLHDLEVAAEHAVYIGDHPEKDVQAAQNVGMKGIWVANVHYARPSFADGVIEQLAELPLLISTFQAG